MRDLRLLDRYRRTGPEVVKVYGWIGDETCGAFEIESPIDGGDMIVIASSEFGWDHVSVSRANRCPNWPEMEHVHRLFFKDDETTMQLHVPAKDHVNCHPYCLHLWRPQYAQIPRPPAYLLAPDQGPQTSAL
jgi:hypothetical protein